jgi:hypothetical protein
MIEARDRDEPRRAERTSGEIWVKEISKNSWPHRRGSNLWRGGIFLDHTTPIAVGTHVRLSFNLPGDVVALNVTARIASITFGVTHGMRAEFVDVEPRPSWPRRGGRPWSLLR